MTDYSWSDSFSLLLPALGWERVPQVNFQQETYCLCLQSIYVPGIRCAGRIVKQEAAIHFESIASAFISFHTVHINGNYALVLYQLFNFPHLFHTIIVLETKWKSITEATVFSSSSVSWCFAWNLNFHGSGKSPMITLLKTHHVFSPPSRCWFFGLLLNRVK